MANLIPKGVDDSTGQLKELTSSDTLVDTSGSPIGGGGANPQVLNSETTTSNTTNTATVETLHTYTLPANTVTANGDSLRIVAYGRNGTIVSPLFAQLLINSVAIAEASVSGDDSWIIEMNIVRQSSTTGRCVGVAGSSSTAFQTEDPGVAGGGDPDTSLTGINFAANQDIVLRAARTGGMNVPTGFTCDQLQVIYQPTP